MKQENKKEYYKKYYIKNKIKKKEYAKEYRIKNKKQIKKYNIKNQKKIKEKSREYYIKNKEIFNEYNIKNREKRKEKYIKFKKRWVDYKGGKCQICGYNDCLAALDFHHIGEKEFSICRNTISKQDEIIKKELDKCILVCSNCHRKIHYEEYKFEEIIEKVK